MAVENPTISQIQESLKTAEEARRQSIVKHVATAAACAVVGIFAVQCSGRYLNESDFVKVIVACDTKPTVRVESVSNLSHDATITGGEVAISAMKSKNECVRDVLDFYQKNASIRPVITIDKNDYHR